MATKPDFTSMNVYQKLHYVQGKIGWVEKGGRNTQQNYDYVTEPDILTKVNPLLGEAGLAFTYSVKNAENYENFNLTKSGDSRKTIARVLIECKLVNIEKPEEVITVCSVGDGWDNIDKGIFKAMTGASKYAMLKLFMMPTGDEPEKDQQEEPPPEKPAPKPKPKPKPKQLTVDEVHKMISAKDDEAGLDSAQTWLDKSAELYKDTDVEYLNKAITNRRAVIKSGVK